MSAHRIGLGGALAGCAICMASLGFHASAAAADPGGFPHASIVDDRAPHVVPHRPASRPGGHAQATHPVHPARPAGPAPGHVTPSTLSSTGSQQPAVTTLSSPSSPTPTKAVKVHKASKLPRSGHEVRAASIRPGAGPKARLTSDPAPVPPLVSVAIEIAAGAPGGSQPALAGGPGIPTASGPVARPVAVHRPGPAASLLPLGALSSPFVAAAGSTWAILSLRSGASWQLPAGLVAIAILMFIVLQSRIDRRDPKLAEAPEHSNEETIGFD